MDSLSRCVFVFTGDMSMSRDEAKSKVVLLGARTTTAVSSKTTHLVIGNEPGPSKIAKAKELNIKIINEEEFMKMLDKNKINSNQEVNTNILDPKSKDNNEMLIKQNIKNGLSWSEKYRPKTINDLVGNKSVFDQLNDFLQGKTDKKAALLSGSPGIGKTTAALLICRFNNYIPIEFNASDLRSKKSINEQISNVLNNGNIFYNSENRKNIIIMDEVDGMTSDRGGIPELVNLIKKTKTLIICICNDKTHPKMRTLANHCLDLNFRKLDSRAILPRIKYILEKEGKCLSDGIINEIILNSNGDMRYILNTVQSLTIRDSINFNSISKSLVQKNVLKGIFDVASSMFQRKNINEKTDLYFEDYSLVPLFVQENYIKCNFRNLKELLISADSISFSDVIDSKIHGSEQEWSLMPYHAFFSSIYPLNSRILQKRIDFPLYLGQYSKFSKNSRNLNSIVSHFKYNLSKKDFRLYLSKFIYSSYVSYLECGKIDDCINIIKQLQFTKDDLISIGDILNIDEFKAISTKYKTALTREYKKLKRILPYSISNLETSLTDEE